MAHVTHSSVAIVPRRGYSTFRHVAITPRCHVLEAQHVIFAAFAKHFGIGVADTTFRRGNVSTFHVAMATKCKTEIGLSNFSTRLVTSMWLLSMNFIQGVDLD